MKIMKISIYAILLLSLLSSINAQEIGCCTNPNAGPFACNNQRLVRRDECCPVPDASFKSYYNSSQNPFGPNGSIACNANNFFVNQDCVSINSCNLGCCCSTLGGTIKSKIQCQTSQFYENQLDCSVLCPTPQCVDGFDNDNDGCADYDIDTGCTSFADTSEVGGICVDTGPQCNNIDYVPKINNFNVNPVKGEKKFQLSWTDECASVASFYEIQRCSGNCTSFLSLGTTLLPLFTDESNDLQLGPAYTYKVLAYYNVPTAVANTNKTARLGSPECLGRYSNNMFCSNNSPWSCDSFNRLVQQGQRCQTSQVCLISSGNPTCANRSACNYNAANPFGLFYTQSACENARYCFYDRSYASVDSCYACSEVMKCYDYKSKNACEKNNCMLEGCVWNDMESEIGTGSCVNANEYNCKWCTQKGTPNLENSKSSNEVFESCTLAKSVALSYRQYQCYYQNGFSKNCNEVICKDYSQADCGTAQITLDGKNNITISSNDQCAINVCQFMSGQCAKNADGDGVQDCATDGCELDYYPPTTTIQPLLNKGIPSSLILSIHDKNGPNGSAIIRTSGNYETHFCVGAACSSPFNATTQTRRIVISGLSAFDSDTGTRLFGLFEGPNIVSFYSKDPANNLEIVKQITIDARSNSSSPILRNLTVSNSIMYNNKLYTSQKRPTVNVLFFEPAIITFAQITSSTSARFSLPITSTTESDSWSLQVPSDLNDGTYTIEINAKNSKNVYMASQARQILIIDTQNPSLNTTPKANEIINSTPLFVSLNFDEEVLLSSVKIGSEIKNSFTTQDNKRFTASINATDGNKNLEVISLDFSGNRLQTTIPFVLDALPTTIDFARPKYGVASSYTFDLEIQTDNNAQCRYSFDNDFEYNFMENFDSTGTSSHLKRNFNKIPSNDITVHRLYVKCKDTKNRESSKAFDISVDTTRPIFRNVFAFPNPVVEDPVVTALTVETDEPAICRYSAAQTTFNSMEHNFAENNLTFRTTNVQNVSLPGEGKYSFNIACINKAELSSETRLLSIDANFSNELIITSRTQEFFNGSAVVLAVETNKRSQCRYSELDPTVQTGDIFGSSGYMHRKDLVANTGKHTFYVICRDAYLQAYSSVAKIIFTIDTTPPDIISVDDTTDFKDTQKSCFTDRLRVRMQGYDNESRVKEFEYTILRKSDNSAVGNTSKTSSSDWILIRSLNLVNNTEYYFTAKAVNFAGYSSQSMSSDGVTIDTSICFDSNTTCGQRGDCKANDPCRNDYECESSFCQNSRCTQATCTDNIKNQQETAIDCAGPCKKCDLGKACIGNNDCDSGHCYFGTCATPDRCDDGQLTPGESDVDCGGPCLNRCTVGKRCDFDVNCADGLRCVSSLCEDVEEPQTQEPVSTDSDGDGIPDSWELDNGLDPNDPNDRDLDADGDGLANFEEYSQIEVYGAPTNPNLEDTDGDGFSDKEEVDEGTSPIDAEQYPQSSFLKTLLIIIGAIVLLSGFGYLGYTMVQKRKEEEEIAKMRMQPRPMMRSSISQPMQRPMQPMQIRPQMQQPQTQIQPGINIKKSDFEKDKERKKLFEAFDDKAKSGSIQPAKPDVKIEQKLEQQKIEPKIEPKTEQKIEESKPEKKDKEAKIYQNKEIPKKKTQSKKDIPQKNISQKKKPKSKEDVFQKLKQISNDRKKEKRKK